MHHSYRAVRRPNPVLEEEDLVWRVILRNGKDINPKIPAQGGAPLPPLRFAWRSALLPASAHTESASSSWPQRKSCQQYETKSVAGAEVFVIGPRRICQAACVLCDSDGEGDLSQRTPRRGGEGAHAQGVGAGVKGPPFIGRPAGVAAVNQLPGVANSSALPSAESSRRNASETPRRSREMRRSTERIRSRRAGRMPGNCLAEVFEVACRCPQWFAPLIGDQLLGLCSPCILSDTSARADHPRSQCCPPR